MKLRILGMTLSVLFCLSVHANNEIMQLQQAIMSGAIEFHDDEHNVCCKDWSREEFNLSVDDFDELTKKIVESPEKQFENGKQLQWQDYTQLAWQKFLTNSDLPAGPQALMVKGENKNKNKINLWPYVSNDVRITIIGKAKVDKKGTPSAIKYGKGIIKRLKKECTQIGLNRSAYLAALAKHENYTASKGSEINLYLQPTYLIITKFAKNN